jgi:hypothetical protein
VKTKIKILAHVSQAMGSDLKFLATRPSTSSLKFEIQLQRMKKKYKIPAHVSQSLGSDINKQLEV